MRDEKKDSLAEDRLTILLAMSLSLSHTPMSDYRSQMGVAVRMLGLLKGQIQEPILCVTQIPNLAFLRGFQDEEGDAQQQ